MKKILLYSMLLCVLCNQLFPISLTGGERHRVFILARVGHADWQNRGPVFALGAEARVIARLYSRFFLDYIPYPKRNEGEGGIEYALGVNLVVFFNIPLSKILDFSIHAGGHYTAIKEQFVIPGASYSLLETGPGPVVGLGFRYQLSNRIYIDIDGTIKYLPADASRIWYTAAIGLTYRVR